jgi:hypothetical protein
MTTRSGLAPPPVADLAQQPLIGFGEGPSRTTTISCDDCGVRWGSDHGVILDPSAISLSVIWAAPN